MMLGHAFVRGLTNTTLVLWAGWGLWLLIGVNSLVATPAHTGEVTAGI